MVSVTYRDGYHYPTYPPYVNLETFCYCNAKCIFCNYQSMVRNRGKMSMDLVHKVVDEVASWNIPVVFVPAFYGEPFLDPDIFNILRYIDDTAHMSKIDMFTNGSVVDDKKIDELVKIKNLRSIGFSLYAYYPETYERLMGLPNDTILKIDHALSRFESERPDIVTCVAYTSDPYYLSGIEFELMAKKWGKYSNPHRMVYNKQMPIYIPTSPQSSACATMFTNMVVSHNGVVALCCHDVNCEITIGDVTKDTLFDIWNGETANKYRDFHACGKRKIIPLCESCTYDGIYSGIIR